MLPKTLGVIGLGAIGGSVAWQAARSGVQRVVGYTVHPKDGVAAVRVGAVTELVGSPERVVSAADLVVLAPPPRATLDLLDSLGGLLKREGVYCTDVSSVKAPVVELGARLGLAAVFAGSHPFAGTHESGFEGAAPDRFEGSVVYVTPLDGGEQAAREVSDFWERVLGASTILLPAERHDETLAWTSHLPQVVASALAGVLSRHQPQAATLGSGALSTTRLAASSVELWTDVLLMNSKAVVRALGAFEGTAAELRRALESRDVRAVREWLECGRDWRRRHGL